MKRYIIIIGIILMLAIQGCGGGCDGGDDAKPAAAEEKAEQEEAIKGQQMNGTGTNKTLAKIAEVMSDIVYLGGDEAVTCAEQKGAQCDNNQVCADMQYIMSNDAKKCCTTGCITRMVIEDVVLGDSTISVEKFEEAQYGVWWGEKVDGMEDIVGHPNFAEATTRAAPDSTSIDFTVEGNQHSCKIIESEDETFMVESCE